MKSGRFVSELRWFPACFQLNTSRIALSTSCSKSPEKLLQFKNVATLNFNHPHIHCMTIYSINFGPNELFVKRNNFSALSLDASLQFFT